MKPIITLLVAMANPVLQKAESKIPLFREKCKNPDFFKSILNPEGEKSWDSMKVTLLNPLRVMLNQISDECIKVQATDTFTKTEAEILQDFMGRCKKMIDFMNEIETTVDAKIEESKK